MARRVGGSGIPGSSLGPVLFALLTCGERQSPRPGRPRRVVSAEGARVRARRVCNVRSDLAEAMAVDTTTGHRAPLRALIGTLVIVATVLQPGLASVVLADPISPVSVVKTASSNPVASAPS